MNMDIFNLKWILSDISIAILPSFGYYLYRIYSNINFQSIYVLSKVCLL